VRATGGVGAPIDTANAGHFSLPITLNTNATNQLKLSASDASKSISDSISVTIRQDNQAPTIAQATPADASDNVALSTTILVRLSEPAVLSPGGGVRLTRQGVTIPGATSISADSLTLTFVPSGVLSPNGIYRIGFTGVADVVGNAPSTSTCFVTTMTGLSASATSTDPTGVSYDVFGTSFPATVLAPDLVAGRFGREGNLFSAVFQFVGARTFSSTASNRAGILFDLDLDQDSTTGFRPFKDSILIASAHPTGGPYNGFDTLTSGTRAEYLIDLEPDPVHGDSAEVVHYTGYLAGTVTALFVPDPAVRSWALFFPGVSSAATTAM